MEKRITRDRPPQKQKRKLTKAAKAAYARAATIGVVALALLGVSVYGATQFLGSSSPETKPAASQGQSQPQIETMGSSSITVLTGSELKGALESRIQKIETSNAAAEASTQADTAAAPSDKKVTPVTPTPVVPTVFDPAAVGTSGFSNVAAWKAQNNDVVGWLKIPNTNINYPVVVGATNNTYASIGYYKEPSKNGVIWADSDTKFGSRSDISQNTVLYGHNWTNVAANPRIAAERDVMFGQLTGFHHLSFAQVTPYIFYSTNNEEMTWKVFAVFYTEESFNYIAAEPGKDGMDYIIGQAKERSRHNYDVDVNSSDKILTLSTCTRAYGQTDKQRFVVMARLMRPDEEITPVTITANPNPKQPAL